MNGIKFVDEDNVTRIYARLMIDDRYDRSSCIY